MNQILFFEEKGIGSSMNKTVKFFAISMIAFGLILLGEGGYSVAKNRNNKTSQIATIQEAENLKPEINFEQNNSKLKIKINGKAEISKVTYRWNDEIEKDLLQVSDQKSIEREIDVPTGTNNLNIKVIYKDGENFQYEQTKEFTMNSSKIDFNLKGANIKITVEDQKGIDYISYKWNDEEEHIEKPDSQDNKNMEVLAEIPFGLNTLTATVINMFGEKSEATLDVKGTEKPVITANLLETGNLLIEVTCADNIENIQFSINGEQYKLNISDFIAQGYTIEQLNNSQGLHVEANEQGKITSVKYEFQTQLDTMQVEITAKSKYTTQTVSGTLARTAQ